MKIQEFINLTDAISQPLGRDEYIDSKVSYFNNANIVYTINNLNLKKYISTDQEELYYGLFDKSKLVAILQLESIKQGWQVRLTQVQEPYKSQGYGSFMYDYAVMNDGLTLLSDTSQTEGQLGGSKGLWEKLYRQGRFTVGGYNLETDEFITPTVLDTHKPLDEQAEVFFFNFRNDLPSRLRIVRIDKTQLTKFLKSTQENLHFILDILRTSWSSYR